MGERKERVEKRRREREIKYWMRGKKKEGGDKVRSVTNNRLTDFGLHGDGTLKVKHPAKDDLKDILNVSRVG